MRHFIVVILSLFLLIIQIHAKEKTDQILSIERLIKQIKNSSSDDRRVAMNRLKIELRKMNKETRKKVMLELQNSFAAHHTKEQKVYPYGIMNTPHHPMQTQQQRGGMQHTMHIRDGQPGGHR